MKNAIRFLAGLCVGIVILCAVTMGRGNSASDCPDVYDLGLIIEACQTGMQAYCERLNKISAKCLLDRSAEASEIKRPKSTQGVLL